MEYWSDSSSEEDLQDAISQVLKEEDIGRAVWLADRHLDEKEEEESLADSEPIKEPDVKIASRAYQLEMLDKSLKGNVIVAMDTGTGKTQVAILRMEAELASMASDQLIWFLAPTKSLCNQQFEVIHKQIPQVQSKLIVGDDDVDSWSIATWDTALINVKIVITTHQVLLDALLHGFVNFSSLALLVFDEAHNCINNHPYSRIMREFYWTSKNKRDPVPHILGLTASPVFNEASSLEKLEQTLDSVCRSPTRHREELMANSQRPSLVLIPFKPELQFSLTEYSESIRKLVAARNKLKIMEDPYIVILINDKSDRARRQLEKALRQKSTYVQDTMKQFCRRSMEMATKIGSWAADWYIFETIRRFLSGVRRQGVTTESWRDAEVVYLAQTFQDADIRPPPPVCDQTNLSNKVQQLIKVLVGKDDKAKGIVFAKERATTAVLGHILATHPEVKSKFKTGSMVGTSFVPSVKQDLLDLPEAGRQPGLDEFRAGTKNLLVATSVLEEGIDVPACNLIICLDKPDNLKSFIQRRGRARQRDSHLYIFEDEQDVGTSTKWEELEAEMKRQYEDDMRKLQKLEALEDDPNDLDYPELHIESTGAHLTIKDAKSHLNHFCMTLTSGKYVNQQPDYIIEKLHESARPGAPILLKATVLLPITVPKHVRQATSARSWLSEKMACMDAAFQAYAALHGAGLLNDHLLPLRPSLKRGMEVRPGMMTVRTLANPWLDIARAWVGDQPQLHRRMLRVFDQSDSLVCKFELVLPRAIPDLKPMVVWWNHDTRLTLRLDSDVEMADGDPADDSTNGADGVGGHTHVLLALAYCHRTMVIKDDCVLRLVSPSGSLSTDQIGHAPFTPELSAVDGLDYLVRDERENSARHPYFFDKYLPAKPPLDIIQKAYKGFQEEHEATAYLAVKRWPKKSGFFQRPVVPQQLPSSKQYDRIIPAESATIDGIPAKYAQFGLLIPALIHYIEIYLLAADLCQNLLGHLKLSDVSKVVDAICASSARTPTNYERVEFLGDSILKTCITVNVAGTELHLPEGLLSLLKDRLVSNERLRHAATTSGLDQFIVTQQLVLKGWRAPYISDLLNQDAEQSQGERTLATKTLADVVEALIGVSYLDGGIPKALDCISFLIQESRVTSFEDVRKRLFAAAEPKNMSLPADLAPLETLLEYTFQEKALLVEAVTHPSYNLSGVVACYDRLEFIGDAILDFIVVEELYAVDYPVLANFQMHLLRSALVNADILGFFVMEYSHKEQRFDIIHPTISSPDKDAGSSSDSNSNRDGSRVATPPKLTQTEVEIPLWSFMRQASLELSLEREATKARHAVLREPILAAIETGTHYPWALLARLHASKFYSDLFEALVGALWVDSGPDFDACRRFVEKIGILPYMRRLLRDRVHALHPKEELGRLAARDKVDYVVTEEELVEDGVERKSWACEVLVGGRSVVAVGGCLFKEEAKVTAATRACQIMKDDRKVAAC
ncbi:unnamed protein product [Discula destructiva]